jgi:peptide/nickel transport system permease protein
MTRNDTISVIREGVKIEPAGSNVPATPQKRRTLLQSALLETFSRTGAKLGLTWIIVLALVGAFAPFIANSHPILLRTTAGELQSPLLKSLSPADVILAAMGVVGVALSVWRRFSLGRSVLIVLITGAVVFIPAAMFFKPHPATVYQQYREAEAAGQYQWVWRTVVPYSPNDRMRDRPEEMLKPPTTTHWLGTSVTGEDILSRMIHACRVALTIGFVSTGIAVVIGIFIGGIMGYFAGWIDLILMRILEIIEAIPTLILLLIVTVSFQDWARQNGISPIYLMMVVIGLKVWTGDARFIRAEFLRLRQQDFVQAGIALGLPLRSLLFRHMLPNGIAPVLVNSSFSIAGAILLESTLSFLGMGLGAEDPSWGQLLNQARSGGTGFNWWIATFPGLAIFLTVFSYVMIGEAMRDALDPRLKKRE